MSRKQTDEALARYYTLKESITLDTQYYDENNIGKFSKWCEENGYDTDKITDELNSETDIDKCPLIQFDPNFPTTKCGTDGDEEIFKIIQQCWNDANAFSLQYIIYQQQDPNIFILQYLMKQQHLLFDGYLRQQIYIKNIPMDIINLCSLFFILNIKSMYNEIEREFPNQKAIKNEVNRWYLTKLAHDISVVSQSHSIGYNMLSMLISSYKYNIDNNNNNNIAPSNLYFNRAYILREKHLFLESEKDIKMAIDIDPNVAEYKYLYGSLFYKQAKYTEAMNQYIAAIDLNETDNHWKYHGGVANCFIKLRDVKSAQIHFKKAIELKSDAFNINKQYAKFLRDWINDYKESKIYYKKCLRINNKKRGVNGSYGYLLYLMGEYDEAQKHFEIEFGINERNRWVHYYYALLNKTLGNEIQADISLNKAIEYIQKPADMLLHLEKMMEADPENMDFHQKFESAIKRYLQ